MKINEILKAHNLGELPDEAVINASGITNIGEQVWLPQINDNDYWINIVLENEGVILQKSKKGRTGRDGNTAWNSAVVITRDKLNNVHKKLPDKYRPVYCNEVDCLTIHAKENSPAAQGAVQANGNIKWVSGFADTVLARFQTLKSSGTPIA